MTSTLFDQTIAEKFRAFHAENPEIYAHLRTLALEAKSAGFSHYGIKSLWELTRWHFTTGARDADGFRANNNFTAHYARLLMESEPALADFFRLRELRAA